MKKYIISTTIALSALGFAYAQEAAVAITQNTEVKTGEVRPPVRSMMATSTHSVKSMEGDKGDNEGHTMMRGGPGMEGQGMMHAAPQAFLTGDATVDAKIKALMMEREAKIKAINEEYAIKLRALIGDKKPLTGTSTRPMMMKKEMGHTRGMRTRDGGSEVKGEYTEVGADMSAEAQTGIRAFFSRLFGH